MKTIAVVPAAGSGSRLKKGIAKPFIKINTKPLLIYTLETLDGSPVVDKIILVVAAAFVKKAQNLLKRYGLTKVKKVVKGGASRMDSVIEGLKHIDKDTDLILVHDGARPCLEKQLIVRAVKKAEKFGAACVCVPVKPTIKLAKNGCIYRTLDRSKLWEAQTPQVFKTAIGLKAYRGSIDKRMITDDSSLIERMGHKVAIVQGSYRNIKVTTEEDLVLAKHFLLDRGKSCA